MKTLHKPGDTVTCYDPTETHLDLLARYTIESIGEESGKQFFKLKETWGAWDVARFCPIPVAAPVDAKPTTLEQACIFLDEVKALLITKNAAYGNSASEPLRIFSKTDAVEQLKVRIDDKLSRIARGAGLLAADEDVLKDLVGYFALLHAQLRVK